MKSYVILFLLVLLSANQTNKAEEIVSNYLLESNRYNFEKASVFLDPNYKEEFIDGSTEVENLQQLKDFMAWRKVLNSKSTLLSIKASNDTVNTVESIYHFMDEILERKPRTFSISYVFKGDKILKSIIDTLPGHSETVRYNRTQFMAFQKFCDQEGIDSAVGMNGEGAQALKNTLERYKKSR